MYRMRHMKMFRFILAVLLSVCIGFFFLFLFTHSRTYFGRRVILGEQRYILSYGGWAPVFVFSLILLSTIIPPLPLPVPLIEIAAGFAFGFLPGALVVWISQVLSS